MNQLLKYVNFVGIIALAVLCAAQWKTNSWLTAQLLDLRKKSDDQAVVIAKQTQTLKENAADLEDFRQRLTLAESQLKKTESDLAAARAERDQLSALKERLLSAVAQRDQVLKEQTDVLTRQVQSIRTLEDQRNQAIVKFNDLVAKYNALVSGAKS